jgi:uncharacterized protein involved in type VI secretion and phage assembly
VVNRPVDNQDEATTLAKAVFDSHDGSFVQAEGTTVGNPAIKPGMTVPMGGLGTKLSGKYYVTSATHKLSSEGYTTDFVVSGRQTNSLIELLDARTDNVPLPSVVIGVVTDNTDPDKNQGRVKVKFPWLNDQEVSWWARIASPMAGKGRGFMFLPEVDDEVLVSFEHGDITRPYILGALWNGKDNPPKKNSEVVTSSEVNERLIKTRAGHTISLVDTDKSEKISITSKSGHAITLDDTSGSELISIIDKTGNNLIKIESSSNQITIQANGDIAVSAQGNASVKTQGNIDVEATGNATVKAQGNVDVEAGMNATVKANAEAKVQAMALELKGSLVTVEAEQMMSIKGGAMLKLEGQIVMIN